MKKVVLLVLVLAGTWWYFIGGRTLSEKQVRDFYANVEAATLEREPDKLCAFLASDFTSVEVTMAGGQNRTSTQDKNQTCEGYRSLYDSWEKLGEKMGGVLQLDSAYTIHSLTLSSDNKTATVDISSSLDVAGSIMNISSRSTDTLVRRNGKVLVLRSEGKGTVRAAGV